MILKSLALAVAVAATPVASASPATNVRIAATVHIEDFTYAPTPVHVRAGDRVRFVNDDDEAHTVTASDKTFDSQGLDTAGSWDHVFSKPGTYTYFCELHPYMKGVVMVSE